MSQQNNPEITHEPFDREKFLNRWSQLLDDSVQHMLQFLNENTNIKEFVKNFDDNKKGFMFSSHPYVHAISSSPLVEQDGHSGASFACCLRQCQKILNNLPPSGTT